MSNKLGTKLATISAAGALLFLIFANGLVCFSDICRESKNIDGWTSWWLAKAYFTEKSPPDIVVLGNSQLGALLGADAYVYDRKVDITGNHRSYVLEYDFKQLLNKTWKVFVAAVPGAMISDQLVISRALFKNNYQPRLVAITICPRDFIDKCFPSVNSTESSLFFSDYGEIGSLSGNLGQILQRKYKIRSAYNTDIDQENPLLLSNPFEKLYPGKIVIRSGEGYFFEDNTNEYRLRYSNPFSQQFYTQLSSFDSLLKYLAQQHIKVVVFGLPLTSINRQILPKKFWQLYSENIITTCKKYDADWIDIDNDFKAFSDSQFLDGVHLNLPGGERLASTIALFAANKFHWRTFAQLRNDEKKMF